MVSIDLKYPPYKSKTMKIKSSLLLLFTALLLLSCSSDDSGGNTNPSGDVRIKSMLFQEYIGSSWKDKFRTTNTFAGSNLMMSSALSERWDDATSQWVNSSRSTYTLYDSSHASEQLIQVWEAGSWVNDAKHTFTDNALGNRLLTETDNWHSGAWQRGQKASFIYDANDYLIRTEVTSWNTASADWNTTFTSKSVYTNNAAGKPVLTEVFSNIDTEPIAKETITYDTNGFLIKREGQSKQMGLSLIHI